MWFIFLFIIHYQTRTSQDWRITILDHMGVFISFFHIFFNSFWYDFQIFNISFVNIFKLCNYFRYVQFFTIVDVFHIFQFSWGWELMYSMSAWSLGYEENICLVQLGLLPVLVQQHLRPLPDIGGCDLLRGDIPRTGDPPPGNLRKSNWQQILGSGPQVWGTS